MIIEIEKHTEINGVLCTIDAQATARINAGSKLTLEIHDNKYSKKQRGASHVWYKLCSDYLNDSGFTRKGKSKITGDPIEIPWTDTAFKAFYKDVLYEYNQMLSTEDQESTTPSEIREIVHRYFSDRGGCLPPWPSKR